MSTRLLQVATYRVGQVNAATKAERHNQRLAGRRSAPTGQSANVNHPVDELTPRLISRAQSRARLAELYLKGLEQLKHGAL